MELATTGIAVVRLHNSISGIKFGRIRLDLMKIFRNEKSKVVRKAEIKQLKWYLLVRRLQNYVTVREIPNSAALFLIDRRFFEMKKKKLS